MTKYFGFVFALALVALGGCQQAAVPAKQAPQPTRLDHDPVAAIRAAGKVDVSSVEVQPLRDPAVDGFLKQAREAESAQRYDDAIAAATRALKLAPDAPEILQFLAELEIARGAWQRSEELATKSFSLGPKVGSLCARNWQTVIEARTALNDAAKVAEAQQQLRACKVPARVRM